MYKITKLDNISAAQEIHTTKDKIYTYSDGVFSKSLIDGSELETLDFNSENHLCVFQSDVLAYVDNLTLKVEQLKKETTLVDLPFHNNRINSIALSPSALHTIVGNENGTVNVVHNISANSILKFTLFSNGDSTDFVDFIEENIIMGSTKKLMLLINILEKGVIAKIQAKGIITSIITSKNKIVYATREKDIYVVDIEDLSNITTKRIATIDDEIIKIVFSYYKNSVFVLSKKSLSHVDFDSNLENIDIEIEDACSLSLIDNNSVIIGFETSSMIIDGLKSQQDENDEEFTRPADKEQKKRDKNLIRFLSVDDSATIRLVIKKSILNNFDNVEVAEANDGVEAMAYLDKNPDTDVVLLDWNMPNMNGGEVVDAISKIDKLSKVKIIMATTEGGKDKVKEMLSKGVKGYLVKPFRPKSVIPMIEKLVEVIQKERIAGE